MTSANEKKQILKSWKTYSPKRISNNTSQIMQQSKTMLVPRWNDVTMSNLNVVCCLLFPPTGCSRADTLLNVHFVLFFTVFSASRQCCPGGQEQLFLRVMFSAFVHLHWFLQCFSRFRTLVFFAPSAFSLGFYSVFRLHDVGDATPRWGGGC